MEFVTVGRAAALTGLTPKAVRLYERKGLLPEAQRTEAGYRLFTAADLDVLHFIRRAKALDLTLDEIKDVLDLQRGGEQPCARVTGMLEAHIAEIDRKLADLRRLRRSLLTARRAATTARRGGHDVVVCHIIENAPTAAGQQGRA
jgi:MerR family copper efflux transcriptional regulator